MTTLTEIIKEDKISNQNKLWDEMPCPSCGAIFPNLSGECKCSYSDKWIEWKSNVMEKSDKIREQSIRSAVEKVLDKVKIEKKERKLRGSELDEYGKLMFNQAVDRLEALKKKILE